MRNVRLFRHKVAAPTVSEKSSSGFPKTRFQGSKLRFLPFLEATLGKLEFDSAVDVFGGTGAVSYLFKRLGKRVHYNDALLSNHASGLALIENASRTFDVERARALFEPRPGVVYDDFIARTFEGVFYLAAENACLDLAAQNIAAIAHRVDRALARHALFQACLMKRPFNLFHRKNLSVRTANVKRSFGNKTTWERPFPELCVSAMRAANAAVFDNGEKNRATALDAFECPLDAELVYLDPPYVRANKSVLRYLDGYHFLEGICRYRQWPALVDHTKLHLPLRAPASAFEDARTIEAALDHLFERAREARFIALSYRDDGFPSIAALSRTLRKLGRRVERVSLANTYALANKRSREVLLVASRKQG